tara:strand:+ start:46 stop:162 length:117 start_codon:yes stop_codon:yes gene_type:complete
MKAKVYAKIMKVVSMNCNDRDYEKIERFMSEYLLEEVE